MSSPFSSLKKGNRNPNLPGSMSGHRPIPFRHPEYSEDESKLLEEITMGMASSRMKARDPFLTGLPKMEPSPNPSLRLENMSSDAGEGGGGVGETGGQLPPPTDRDLMRLMMARLAVMEQQVRQQEQEIRLKDRRIKVLEDNLRILAKSRKNLSVGTSASHSHPKSLATAHPKSVATNTYCEVDASMDGMESGSRVIADIGVNTYRDGDASMDGMDSGSRAIADIGLNTNSNGGMFSSEKKEEKEEGDLDEDLETHCILLQQQVHEMESFLADYGMVWVGSQPNPESDIFVPEEDPDDLRRTKQSMKGLELNDADQLSGQPFAIDFDRLVHNIRDLNVIAGEGESRVQRTTDGARLRKQKHVPVTFYANGMMMFEGPFRSYSDPLTVQCVQDFMDGYFPSELQLRFPDGVPFDVKDMRSVHFKPVTGVDVFSGTGMTLGGLEQESRLVSRGRDEEMDRTRNAVTDSASETSERPFPPVRMTDFLNRLPQSVIKGGKVIDIRDSVGEALTGHKAGVNSAAEGSQAVVVETKVTKEIQKSLAESESKGGRPKTARDITTLRIKSEEGSHTYIVKLKFSETVRDLRGYLDRCRVGMSPHYDICSVYPRKRFSDDDATMESCGLVPNAVLYLQAKRKA